MPNVRIVRTDWYDEESVESYPEVPAKGDKVLLSNGSVHRVIDRGWAPNELATLYVQRQPN